MKRSLEDLFIYKKIAHVVNIHQPSWRLFSFGHSPAPTREAWTAFYVVRLYQLPVHLFLHFNFLYLESSKRIFKVHCQLINFLILHQLVSYILLYLLRVLSYRIDIVSSAPEGSVPILESCLSKIICELLPFKYPIIPDTEYFGGISISIWIWSTHTSASRMFFPFHSHSCLSICPISILRAS